MGRVVSIKDDDSIVIETASDRSRLRIKRWAISTIDTEKNPESKKEEAKSEKTEESKKRKHSLVKRRELIFIITAYHINKTS